MFNKIQPQQINLHTFSSPSGNFSFTQTDTEVKINLYSGLTGSFQVEGNLFVNGGAVQYADKTNTFGGISCFLGAGQSHIVTGTNSAVVGGASNEVSGTRNLILNGNSSQITDAGADGTVVAGYGALISHDGAVVIADARIATKNSVGTNTLVVDFENGAFVQNALSVNETLSVVGSGLFSGNVNVLGQLFITGSEVATHSIMTGFVSGVSGVITGQISDVSGVLAGLIESTGQSLDQRIKFDLDDLVRQTGTQIISGVKEFWDGIKIGTDATIQGTGANFNSIIIEDDALVDLSTGKCITLTSLDSILCLLDTDADGSASYKENNFYEVGGKWNSSFAVTTGTSDPDTAHVRFAVHPSGIGWFKNTIILETPTTIPAATSSAGLTGQVAWQRVNANLTHLFLHNGTEWSRFSGVSW